MKVIVWSCGKFDWLKNDADNDDVELAWFFVENCTMKQQIINYRRAHKGWRAFCEPCSAKAKSVSGFERNFKLRRN